MSNPNKLTTHLQNDDSFEQDRFIQDAL